MRTGVSIFVTPADLDRLRDLVTDRNAPQKHVWRAQIVLLSAVGLGTNAIMRETGKSKTCVLAEIPVGKTIHAILDNYAAHKHPAVRRWLARHPRWTFHFTPTSASWLNAVDGFFAILTKRRLKRGVFRSVADLQAAVNCFVDDHNAQSKPFQWVADPDKIIAAVRQTRTPFTQRQYAP
jgi:hypothetical protein